MKKIKKWVLKYKAVLLGALVGGISGYLYYYFVGCASGTCAITSNPLNSIIYFSVMGGLAINIIKPSSYESKKQLK
jgi:uncharacterized membrane protein